MSEFIPARSVQFVLQDTTGAAELVKTDGFTAGFDRLEEENVDNGRERACVFAIVCMNF